VAAGVPGFFWNQAGKLDYNHIHHTLYDTVDQVDAVYQKHSAIVVAVGAVGLANLDHLLDRTDLVRARPMGNRRMMGVMLDENLITDVIEGSQAEKLGLQPDDLIVAIDGVAVSSREEVVTEIHRGDPTKKVTVLRGEANVDFTFVWEVPKK
jgi:S1-C subfamily serine protease